MERASGLQDQRHNLVTSFVWELPFARNLTGAPKFALAGWAVDGILTLASGTPFNITQSFDGQNNDGLWERPNLVPGQSLSLPNQGPASWFNTAAFTGSILQLNPPAGGSITVTNPSTNPVATIQNPVPASLFPSNPIFNAVSLPPDRRHPNTYVQNWNFQIGHQFGTANLLEVSYVGSKGTHVDTSYQNFNQPDPGPGTIQPRRPYPQFARIRMQNYGANTSYNALQARFERRLRAGVSASVAYSYSPD